MSPTTLTILISTLAAGTIITASSFHWLFAWIGLELNTLAIIPLITKQHHPRATEAATKYFLTQAAASAIILFSSTINAWNTGTWDIMQLTTPMSSTLLTMALAMKLGLAPAHFWLTEVMQGTTTGTAMIIATWQKLAPMAIIILTSNNLTPTILLTMAMLSTIIGGWGGLNQTQLRKILAYSSIAHLGWMAAISTMTTNILTINMILYLLMTTSMFSTLIMTKSKTIQDMTSSWSMSPIITTMTMIILLSLGGLPPLTGFIPKWLIIEELTIQNLTPAATTLAMSALLSLYFYLRLTYTSTLTLSPNSTTTKHKWRFKMKYTSSMLTTSLPISTMLLPITPLILN
uniref:NADH-ubiquinone oxidoreductase chain 2 n=1 Tax=Liolaemus silvai TaxID=1508647 RepID=A0A0N6Y3V2_9SAUR|nr:NADH dehydrogenase subunit 2 [Liolaemus silvai]AID51786.1 NADH dehydrogenase subunit 2 [Liolaemus silvai]AID51789.1 NADH dehydrogenase subunit 2 [Liolaemus silvai]